MVLSHRLANYLSKAASGLLARDSIFLLLGLQTVEILILLIPLAFLLGIMLALGRLYRDHEMTALASPVDALSVYRAVFLLAKCRLCLLPSLSLFVLPATMGLRFKAMAKARKAESVDVDAGHFPRVVLNGRHVVYIGALDEPRDCAMSSSRPRTGWRPQHYHRRAGPAGNRREQPAPHCAGAWLPLPGHAGRSITKSSNRAGCGARWIPPAPPNLEKHREVPYPETAGSSTGPFSSPTT